VTLMTMEIGVTAAGTGLARAAAGPNVVSST